jgi:NAD(P)H dehydrogenase (quinone)
MCGTSPVTHAKETNMTIGITGATGQLGHLVVEALKAKIPATDIVALVRTPAKAADLGVAVRQADYSERAGLDLALTGIDTLLLISSNEIGRRRAQHHNVIEAAKPAHVKWIIYTSLLHADTSALSLAEEHLATEAELRASGITFTILRNGWYTENYTASVPAAVAAGAFVGSAGHARISSAPRHDYADAAVAVLTSGGHAGKTYELAGDEAYTLADLAAEISRQTRKPIPYKDLPEADYAAVLTSVGLPAPVAQAYASFDIGASKGALFDNGHQLSKLIGRPTTPLSIVVERVLTPVQ